MPALYNIQTYEKLNEVNYEPTLNRFKKVLHRVGLWNEDVDKAFKKFEWREASDGFIYSPLASLEYSRTPLCDILVRPHVTPYSTTIESFSENWIQCEFLIESADLRDYHYFPISYDLIKWLTFEMYKEFNQTGIYFTNEAQAGQDFNALRNNNQTTLWEFDYALIPISLEQQYNSPPSTHTILRKENHIEAWCNKEWLVANK